ncbi:MAG: lipocalin-like domain-containing protein [Lachnospiraceae bacterium]|nr:lipocalin-like domain-containing protein [Lachnospiraceae bacterium]
MNRNQMNNLGIPLSVNYKEDMTAKKDGSFDSWYVICNFEAEGEKLAFEWHQQSIKFGSGGRMSTAEFLLTNGSKNICKHNAFTELEGPDFGSDADRLHVFSSWGSLDGDYQKMTLKLQTATEAVDVTLVPTEQVLYNGTTGLLHFGNDDSYQFSFPNMAIAGTLTIEGKTYEIQNATAWFDRQWGFDLSKTESVGKAPGMFQRSWLWLGMTLNQRKTEAISLWDVYLAEGRHTFATFIHENGTQVNTLAEVTYEDIWKSSKSGNFYPRIVNIRVPEKELKLKLVSMVDDPEFVRDQMGLCGCQNLCTVTGSYHGEPIRRDVVLELINNVCGEAYNVK